MFLSFSVVWRRFVSIGILHSDKSELIFETGETNVRRYCQETFA